MGHGWGRGWGRGWDVIGDVVGDVQDSFADLKRHYDLMDEQGVTVPEADPPPPLLNTRYAQRACYSPRGSPFPTPFSTHIVHTQNTRKPRYSPRAPPPPAPPQQPGTAPPESPLPLSHTLRPLSHIGDVIV